MFILIVGLLAFLGMAFVGYKLLTHKGVVSQPAGATSVAAEHPDVAKEGSDETPVATSSLADYKVAADEPRILTIPSLGMKARIRPMGVNSLGAIQAPINIYDSGWYTSSSKPGGYGAMFIDGHASGATRQGLFAYIDTLKIDDTVSVERGDGQVFTYKVVHVETVSKDAVDMNKVLQTYGGASEGLNLMTCTGTWVTDQKTLTQRAIVYTERVS